jgi:hypothetical protein
MDADVLAYALLIVIALAFGVVTGLASRVIGRLHH